MPAREDWDEDRLEVVLFGSPPHPRLAALPMPDFADLHQPRQRHPHLTVLLFWEEYRQANPEGYRYSGFWSACGFSPTRAWSRAHSHDHRAPSTRAQALFRDLAMVRADGSLRSLPARLSRIDVLNVHRIEMRSDSMRKNRGKTEVAKVDLSPKILEDSFTSVIDIRNVLLAEQDGGQAMNKRSCFPERSGDFGTAISVDVGRPSVDVSDGERI